MSERLIAESVCRTPEEWMTRTGIWVLDPDGWRRPGDPLWDEPITRDEFVRRAMMSTVGAWPHPTLDAEQFDGPECVQ